MIGFCTITLLNSSNATMQISSDPQLRGRVMALYMTVVMGGTPLGSPVIGWIGEHLRRPLDADHRRRARAGRRRAWPLLVFRLVNARSEREPGRWASRAFDPLTAA